MLDLADSILNGLKNIFCNNLVRGWALDNQRICTTLKMKNLDPMD